MKHSGIAWFDPNASALADPHHGKGDLSVDVLARGVVEITATGNDTGRMVRITLSQGQARELAKNIEGQLELLRG